MALKTPLRPIVKKIAHAVEAFAVREGIPTDDYAIVGSWNEKTGRIRLILGTDRRIDDRRWYAGIVESIRQTFADEPWVTRNIGLVVQNVQNLDDVYAQFPTDDDEVDLTDMLERS